MPDLNPSSSPASSLPLIPQPIFVKPISCGPPKFQDSENSSSISLRDSHTEERKDEVKENGSCNGGGCNGIGIGLVDLSRNAEKMQSKGLEEYVKEWVQRKVDAGVSENKCYFPFLIHAPKLIEFISFPKRSWKYHQQLAECCICRTLIYPKEEIFCSIRGCQVVCHLTCATERLGLSSAKSFKCPHHACYLCKDKFHLWRCVRCQMTSHYKCAAFKEHVIQIPDHPGQAICWRHPDNWRLDGQKMVPANNIEDIFSRLPLPYVKEEFQIDMSWKDTVENTSMPPPYVHIRRNIYLVKRKKDNTGADIGCTNCRSTECQEDCVCRVQCISCSKACRCSDMCTNRPFRKEKKIRVVKTAHCGWGAVAAESIKKGDFIIEYIGEVINDATCEQRLWDMKYQGVKNFYMCEIGKDFTIDATFKGNSSRFLNHSCEPNCKLEKWQVEGETRVGVFAARSIQAGEPLTYDYRFVLFGPEVKCHCGAPSCQGYLGTKKKITMVELDLCWGSKRKRTATACLSIIKL